MNEENKEVIQAEETVEAVGTVDTAETAEAVGTVDTAETADATGIVENTETVEESENSKPHKTYPTQMVLSIRIIVGAYVLYNMYEVLTSKSEKEIWLYILVIMLTIIAVGLIALSLVHYIKGEYVGGKADKKQNEEPEEKAE